jgi:hypothetical protein
MPRIDPVLSLTLATAVASLFLASVIHKIRNPWRFRDALSGFALLPESLVSAAMAVVFVAEFAVVVAFIFGNTRVIGMLLAAALLTLYASAIAVNLLRGRTRIDCGCVGFGERQQLGKWMVVRNLVITSAALAACLPRVSRDLTSIDFFVIVCAALCAAGLYMAQGLLADARQRWQGES